MFYTIAKTIENTIPSYYFETFLGDTNVNKKTALTKHRITKFLINSI